MHCTRLWCKPSCRVAGELPKSIASLSAVQLCVVCSISSPCQVHVNALSAIMVCLAHRLLCCCCRRLDPSLTLAACLTTLGSKA